MEAVVLIPPLCPSSLLLGEGVQLSLPHKQTAAGGGVQMSLAHKQTAAGGGVQMSLAHTQTAAGGGVQPMRPKARGLA
jgi:hypothetical protein